ncbi:hypothetical protein P7K49_013289 [Saguinus oedipus]|uniref:Uncharacterized protein n=1 Tax=Saguinus oedipus TaxID=9490 RepID=A0ABQ9VFI4_SAGOE|nr:hypothetical protein P7K49_013289 [Saguinus oedipus]
MEERKGQTGGACCVFTVAVDVFTVAVDVFTVAVDVSSRWLWTSSRWLWTCLHGGCGRLHGGCGCVFTAAVDVFTAAVDVFTVAVDVFTVAVDVEPVSAQPLELGNRPGQERLGPAPTPQAVQHRLPPHLPTHGTCGLVQRLPAHGCPLLVLACQCASFPVPDFVSLKAPIIRTCKDLSKGLTQPIFPARGDREGQRRSPLVQASADRESAELSPKAEMQAPD